MKKTVKRYKGVCVEWIDSTMRKQVWFSVGQLLEDTKAPQDRFCTIAYLVSENKLEYIFASSVHFEEEEAVEFGQIFTIPKVCVLKIKNIKI